MRMARIGILGMLVLAPGLVGCAEDVPPPPQSLLGPTPAACQQEAQRLGFRVLGVEGTPVQQPDGSTDYPILVQWGNDGGVHLQCRTSGGGVTIE
jgi:hypothetical protein